MVIDFNKLIESLKIQEEINFQLADEIKKLENRIQKLESKNYRSGK